jgi:adenine-specific DNA-methyltransferase
MPKYHLQLDDLRTLNTPENIANIFRRLGYHAQAEPLDVSDLNLSPRNSEAVYDSYLIANQGNSELQVLLFQLQPDEWISPSQVSSRMKSIANQVGQRSTEFLLLATKDYNQLMLINPRKSFDEKMNLKASIRKLLIDRQNPTAYDLDRLEAIAVRGKSPKELYQAHCEAFDVEKLTKSFYKGYKELFDKVQSIVKQYNQIPYFEDKDRLHQFSQRLLGRIMFLYFLQKKEFLTGDRKFLTTQYKVNHFHPDESDYYSEVLEPLFFETLNQQRPNFEHRWGKGQIPYLNGGLFDRDYGEGIKDAAGRETPKQVILPNFLFEPGNTESILSFFNGYNFTVSENTAGDEDVAVDPEMLGKVFENMLAAEERGQSGTFYTPRGIVQFMCSEVLSRYLSDETGMTIEAVQKLINYDSDLPDSEFNSLITPQQARDLKQAISTLKVLDPAVGSGAFPLGMMQVILNVKLAIARREGMNIQRGSLTISQWKREIIANNLYGVDIKPEAIEIAKLRMWLSLVVDIPNIENVEPLPNLDYKLMCGDSLISTIHGEQLIPDPTKTSQGMLAVTPIQLAIQPLLELEKRYFDAQTEERHQLREQILAAEANVFRVAVSDRRNYWLGKQNELETKIKTMKGKVSKVQEKEKAEIVSKLAQLDRFASEVESGERSLNFFQYHLHFRDVFESKGGFDIVIGNPPYVRQEAIKDLKPALQAEYDCYTGVADLYVYFYEQGLRLLKPKGYLSYISSNKYFRAGYGEKLRKYLAANSQIHNITDFGELPVFDAATFPMIFSDKYLIVTKIGINIHSYPAIFKHLKQWEKELKKRTDQGNYWWELRACAYYDAFDKSKIIYPEIAKESRFAFDSNKIYPLKTCFMIPVNDYYLLAILNSICVWAYLKQICSVLGDANKGGRLTQQKIYISQIPIPTASESDKQAIASLVQKCLDAKGVGVEEWEAEIDDRVAYLYGLTDEEMKIIRGE